MSETILKIAILIYDFALVAGTAYLVQVYDWSMWTFLLTMCFFLVSRTKKDEQKVSDENSTAS